MEQILDRYEVLGHLGRGGTADVLRVKDRAFSGRVVALKRCHSTKQNAQLAKEFHALRDVQHPNLPTVFDFHSDAGDGRAAYSLEEVSGKTAEQSVAVGDLKSVIDVMTGVLRVLAHIHGRGYTHADLHPHNIIVQTLSRDEKAVKVLDLSPTQSASNAQSALPYLAPERLEGAKPSPASDLYSVGVVMYRLITGCLPYPNYPHIEDNEVLQHTEQLGRIAPLVHSLLSQRPESRPRNASNVLHKMAELTKLDIPQFTCTTVDSILRTGPTIPIGEWLKHVNDTISTATLSDGGVFVIQGESGTGKSRVLSELRWNLQIRTNAQVLALQASHLATDGDLIRELLMQVNKSAIEELPEHLAEVAESLMTGDVLPGHLQLDQQTVYRRQCDQLAQVFLNFAQHRPLTILVDDFESADKMSLDVLQGLALSLEHSDTLAIPVTLVISETQGLIESPLKIINGLNVTRFQVPAFDYEAVTSLIKCTFSGVLPSHRLATELLNESAGHPLRLVETVSHANRQGWLITTPATIDISDDAPKPIPVPSSAQHALETRLEGLSKSLLDVLGLLRFCSVSVPIEVVTALIDTTKSSVHFQLDALIRYELVRMIGHGRHIQLRLASKHIESLCSARNLIASNDMLLKLRDQIHKGPRARALKALAKVHLGSTDTEEEHALIRELLTRNALTDAFLLCERFMNVPAGLLGDVLARCGQDDRALKAWSLLPAEEANLRIGRLALRRGQYRDGLSQLSKVPNTSHSIRDIELQLLRARAHIMLGSYDEAAAVCEHYAPDVPSWLEPTHYWLVGLIAFYQGNYHDASSAYSAARERFKTSGDSSQEANVLNAIGLLHYRKNELKEAFEAFGEALSIGELVHDRERVLLTLMNLAIVHQVRGNWRLAESRYVEALRMARVTGNDTGVMKVLQNLGNLRRHVGRLSEAEDALRESLALAEADGNHYIATHNLGLLGELAWLQGHPDEAEKLLKCAISAFASRGNVGEEADTERSLAEVLLSLGRHEEAGKYALKSKNTAAQLEQARLEALALATLAKVQHAQGQYVAAGETAKRSAQLNAEEKRPEVVWQSAHALYRSATALMDAETAVKAASTVVTTIEEAAAQIADSERHTFLEVPDRAAALAETRWVTQLQGTKSSSHESQDTLTRLLEVNQRLATELDPSRLLEYIIDSAIQLTGAERGFLLMDSDGNKNPKVVVARNIDQENIRNKKLKVSYSIASQVITTGEAVLTTDAMGDERYTEYLSIHHLKLRSVLCLPMSRSEQVRGALYVDNRFQSGAFSKHDLRFMEAFANQAAIALYNAHILQERAQALEELAASQTKVQELNERLQQQLDEKTKELEATERLLVVQRKQLSRHHGYDTIIGNSPPMVEIFGILDRVCTTDISVLITGESGTGKEVVAKAIHYNGDRQNRPFVALNCSSIPESLIESELFGHVRGAFTGATADKKGMFEVAHRGTLFLDEIGEMPFEMQAKLLRALQEGEIQKVGGTRPIKVDVRIIAATNRNLREMVRDKSFREDLYYRLAIVTVELPALRKRIEDIPLLIEHFLKENKNSNLSPVQAISKTAMRLLLQYQWPGNVRELQTVIKNASIFAETDTLQPDDFSNFPQILNRKTRQSTVSEASDAIVTLAELERTAIIRALEQNRGNKKRTAEMLGIDRRTLYNKLSVYGISIERRAKVTGDR